VAQGRAGEVFGTFLKLGLTSFGGPVAHLGYFREELVVRRRWIEEAGYADLVALCQFLPGPASSQVGFAMGLLRGGALGGLAAWAAFTLPSALLLALFAMGLGTVQGPVGAGALHGLKVVAVAIVAQAVWGMARSLCPDLPRAGIAVAAGVLAFLVAGAFGQVGAIALGALAGLVLCRGGAEAPGAGAEGFGVSRRVGAAALALFGVLLLGLPLLASGSAGLAVFDSFYRAGALVFGGGHVVLPLLEAEVVRPGWVRPEDFLAGYGAAQAVPGPLFTFAAYLGALIGGWGGAALGLVAVFLPGLLLVVGALPFWAGLRARPGARAALRGANAAVVGLLAAALAGPVWHGAVLGWEDAALAAVGFALLVWARVPSWGVVALSAAGGAVLALL
jgi:chromate transporter